ncbi:MAG TPA: hypothetical protein VFS43_28085 [Polyangiaceae bacterium]|nr:hypothetical protein [Polyangiaceae bacterium]
MTTEAGAPSSPPAPEAAPGFSPAPDAATDRSPAPSAATGLSPAPDAATGLSPAGEAVRELLGRAPGLRLMALGARVNAGSLDLEPFGVRAEFLDAAENGAWVSCYLEANRRAFGGPLELPGWVLVDCYLWPGAIGLLVGPGGPGRGPPAPGLPGERLIAAYVALPSVEPGVFMGCSLFSFSEGGGFGRLIKALTLKMLRARAQRGIAQWGNGSLRVHTRMGPLALEGPVPAVHGRARDSFAYRVELGDEVGWGRALRGQPEGEGAGPAPAWVPVGERARLEGLLERARGGERVEICAPGLDGAGQNVRIRAWGGAP